ncbi:hypothetical protein [Rhizobium sp. FKL33]|uniref:hypothetical protein n=1 Tax=Rhizobium sp. FKL33 TaxID=2562307 RepID=UPI0010BFCA0E|nr:hypothetical protein [Rhizobium sp. FKL33]
MSIFDRLDKIVSRTADRAYSVRFTYAPGLKTPNGRPGPDPDRAEWEGKGIFDEGPAYSEVEIGRRDRSGNDLQTLSAGDRFELSVDKARYPLVSQARQGDRIQLDDLRKFEVSAVEPDGMSRVVLRLVKVAG